MPHKRNPITAERICGIARVRARERARRRSRTSRSGTSATSRTPRPSAIVLPDSFLAVDYMLDRFAWLVEGLVVGAERMLDNLDVEPRALLQPAAAARARRERDLTRDERTGSCSGNAMRAWDEELDFRELVDADAEIAGRVDLDAVFDLGRVHGARRTRLRAPARARRRDGRAPSMPEARTSRSGKVREIYALDDERLLLVASRPHLHVRRDPPDADPRQGPRAHRHVGVLVRAHAADRPEPPPRACGDDGRSLECRRLEMLPVELVVRGYLSGSGWVDYRRVRRGLRPRAACRARESDRLPAPIVTPATKADEGHDLNITEAEAAALCGAERTRPPARPRSRSTRFAAAHAEERGIVLADTKFEFGVDPDGVVTLGDEALTPDSSRFWPASEYAPGGPQPSFDKQYVRDFCLATGWDRTEPGPRGPRRRRGGHARALRRGVRAADGDPVRRYLSDPKVVL